MSIPVVFATASAVCAWSPVIIIVRIPARRHAETASAASGRGGSDIPIRPANVRSYSLISDDDLSLRYAQAITRSA